MVAVNAQDGRRSLCKIFFHESVPPITIIVSADIPEQDQNIIFCETELFAGSHYLPRIPMDVAGKEDHLVSPLSLFDR